MGSSANADGGDLEEALEEVAPGCKRATPAMIRGITRRPDPARSPVQLAKKQEGDSKPEVEMDEPD